MKDDTARAAEGVGPYAGCGADSPGNGMMVGAACRAAGGVGPYERTIQNRT